MPDYVLGLDLNDYRKGVDLRQAKRQGVRYVINKATEGIKGGPNWIHSTLEEYREKAKAVNLPFGGYIYWRFVFDAVDQADLYLEHLGEVQFRPIVDVERINNRREGGGPIVSVQANINHLRIVLNHIESETGVKPMIYTNWATWNELFGNTDVFAKEGYELWVANYGRATPWLPEGFAKWVLWQWTCSYRIEDYPRGVDANYYNGNEGDFEEYLDNIALLWGAEPEVPPSAEVIVTGSILRSNGNEELFVLTQGDSIQLRVEKL